MQAIDSILKTQAHKRIEKKTWQILTLKITKTHFKGKVYY